MFLLFGQRLLASRGFQNSRHAKSCRILQASETTCRVSAFMWWRTCAKQTSLSATYLWASLCSEDPVSLIVGDMHLLAAGQFIRSNLGRLLFLFFHGTDVSSPFLSWAPVVRVCTRPGGGCGMPYGLFPAGGDSSPQLAFLEQFGPHVAEWPPVT